MRVGLGKDAHRDARRALVDRVGSSSTTAPVVVVAHGAHRLPARHLAEVDLDRVRRTLSATRSLVLQVELHLRDGRLDLRRQPQNPIGASRSGGMIFNFFSPPAVPAAARYGLVRQ